MLEKLCGRCVLTTSRRVIEAQYRKKVSSYPLMGFHHNYLESNFLSHAILNVEHELDDKLLSAFWLTVALFVIL